MGIKRRKRISAFAHYLQEGVVTIERHRVAEEVHGVVLEAGALEQIVRLALEDVELLVLVGLGVLLVKVLNPLEEVTAAKENQKKNIGKFDG